MGAWRWGMLLVLATVACTKQSLPALPAVDTRAFSPAIREAVQREFAAVQASPRNAERAGRLGMLLHAHDRLEAASVCYKRARLLQPNEYRWLYLSGVVSAGLSRTQEAAEMFRAALAQRPKDAPAQLRLGDALLASGEYGASRASYEAVIQLRPNDAPAYYGAGRAYAAAGDLASAVQFYQRACERYPEYAAAQYALGLAYRQLGRDTEATTHLSNYERAKTAAPPREEPLLAEVQSMSGGILPLLAKAKSAAAAGRLEEAVNLHQQALQADPTHEQIHINLISLYARLKRFDEAEQHYRSAIARNPNRDEAHYNYAVLLTVQGRVPQAIKAYRRTLALNPLHAEANNNLAYLLAQRRSFDEALEHANKALESRPDYPQAHYNAAMILVERGQIRPAIRHLESAARKEPNEPRYLYGLATVYARAGDVSRAREYEQQAKNAARAAQ